MEALTLVLVAAALVAGLTGTWSPCGLSMIETIGPVGHSGGRATTISACVTFFLGALAGGVITFGMLAVLGGILLGAEEGIAYGVAAVLAALAALLEVRGAPIVPQIRRQLPEHWRRLLPMPLAAGLYGVLLGLGFTTFVLTFGVWALAAIAFAVGEPAAGVAIGLAFGVGRALPVVALAPIAQRPRGNRCVETMVGETTLLRAFRVGDGLALAAAGLALALATPAAAENTVGRHVADPSIAGRDLALQRADGSSIVRTGKGEKSLPGSDPALGGRFAAVIRGLDEILVLDRKNRYQRLAVIDAPGVDALAVSDQWLVWRVHKGGRDRIFAAPLKRPGEPGGTRRVAAAGRRSELGKPSVDGDRVTFAVAGPKSNKIVLRTLGGRERRTLVSSRVLGLSNPSIRGGRLIYVRHGRDGDSLMVRAINGATARVVLSRRKGRLWSTALAPGRAYVTHLRGNPPKTKVLSVGL